MTILHPPFKAMVFDLDGTLLDTMPDLVNMTNAALRDFNLPERTFEEIHSFVGNGARALMYQAVPDETPDEVVDEVMSHWKSLYPQMGVNLTKPYEGISESLQQMKEKGVKLAILSNKFNEGVQELVDVFFPNLFEVAYGECNEIPRKPDPTGLLRIVEELGVQPWETVYVGDSPGDMIVAQRASVYALGVSWGYRDIASLKEARANDVVLKASDFLHFV